MLHSPGLRKIVFQLGGIFKQFKFLFLENLSSQKFNFQWGSLRKENIPVWQKLSRFLTENQKCGDKCVHSPLLRSWILQSYSGASRRVVVISSATFVPSRRRLSSWIPLSLMTTALRCLIGTIAGLYMLAFQPPGLSKSTISILCLWYLHFIQDK